MARSMRAWARPWLASILLVIGVAACAPAYDDAADKQLQAAQQKFDEGAARLIAAARRLEALERRQPPPSPSLLQPARQAVGYQANAAWYAEVDAALNSARLRVTADPATPQQIDQSFQRIQENMDDLSSRHEAQDRLSSVVVVAARNEINRQFRALITYQLLLKSGKKPTS